MYSMVLVMALGGGAVAPAWDGKELPGKQTHELYRHRRHKGAEACGCCGGGGYGSCWGSSSYGCSGGYAYGGGCWGSSSYGCSGGYAYGGGCWGSSSYGCSGGYASGGGWGSSYSYGGCTGGQAWGSSYGGLSYGTYSPYDGYAGYGNSMPHVGSGQPYSGSYYDPGVSGSGSYTPGTTGGTAVTPGRSGTTSPATGPGGRGPGDPGDREAPGSSKPGEGRPPLESSTALFAPATLVVALPADAKLTIDNATTRSTSPVRTFVTPPLTAGKAFIYDLKVEIVRDGRTLTESKRVVMRAGQETRTTIDFPGEGVARR